MKIKNLIEILKKLEEEYGDVPIIELTNEDNLPFYINYKSKDNKTIKNNNINFKKE